MEVHHCVQQSLLTWARWIQSVPCHQISVTYILIPSPNLCQSLQSGLLLSGFLSKPCAHITLLPTHPTRSHLSDPAWFAHPNVRWECSFYTFFSSSCYLWNLCSDIKWLVGRNRTTQQINVCTLCTYYRLA